MYQIASIWPSEELGKGCEGPEISYEHRLLELGRKGWSGA